MRPTLIAALTALPTLASADAPPVLTDFGPTHALVSAVMDGVTTPDMLLNPSDDPHDFALRPSDARALADAEIIVWLGKGMTPWLADPLANLADDALTIALLDTSGWPELAIRGDEDGDHGHDHNHDHGEHDPHAWLDPVIMGIWTETLVTQLVDADPENAEIYTANAAAWRAELDALTQEITAALAEVDSSKIMLPHDNMQYLETRFGLAPAGFIAPSDAADPGPAHLRELRELVESGAVTCVLGGASTDPVWITILTEGTDAKTAQLDPIDSAGQGYIAMMKTLAQTLRACAN